MVGNPRAGSRTSAVGRAVVRRITRGKTEPHVIELAELAPELFDYSSERVSRAVEQVKAADLLIVASPTYKATYTGLLKAFLDRFSAGSLQHSLAVPVMLAAAPRHALAVEVHLRPLLVELGAVMPMQGLFILESEVDSVDQVVERWAQEASFTQLESRAMEG